MNLRDRYALVTAAIALAFAVAAGLELFFLAHVDPVISILGAQTTMVAFLYFFRPERWQ